MPRPERALRLQTEAVGRAPGAIVVPEGSLPPSVRVTLYDRERYDVLPVAAVSDLAAVAADGRIAWVDVTGLGSKELLEALVATFGVPWLAVEDVLHSPQRPKVDAYDDARFVVVRMFDRPGSIDSDQFSIFARGRLVLTFQERRGDPFGAIRERLAHGDSQLRQRGADYLVYRLVDACVDSVLPELMRLSETVERVEDDAFERPRGRLLRELHQVRRDLRSLERVGLATRDAMAALARDEEGFFDARTRPYLRDVLDHASHVVELTHYYTSVANDIGALVLGTLDLRMNQVMRVLAAVTVVFLPLSLVAGIYGMNFQNMPELKAPWGYFAVLAFLLALGAGLTQWLKRRGWMSSDLD